MPPTLVIDTSVIIDLLRGALVEAALALPFHFVVPAPLLDLELPPEQAAFLISSGFHAVEIDPPVVTLAQSLLERTEGISAVDSFVLALAESASIALLTGDGRLRRLAESEHVEVHGLLWLLDRIEEAGTADRRTLRRGLSIIAASPRCRLPRDQVRVRLARYAP